MTGLFNTSSLRAQRSNPERHKETAERISPPPPSPPPDQLLRHPVGHRRRRRPAHPAFGPDIGEPVGDLPDAALDLLAAPLPQIFQCNVDDAAGVDDIIGSIDDAAIVDALAVGGGRERSEEHTSELQSLMRISSEVYCLKKQH